jgi:hypothetical protein
MLIEDISVRIDQILTARSYYPCVLLVHTDMHRLQDTVQELAQHTGWPELAVSRVLTDALADQFPARRSTLASTALDRPLADLRPGLVICTDLPLLFEPSLELDPLALLRQWSRRGPVIAAWPGIYSDDGLAYAVPAHAHYRLWQNTRLDPGCIMPL